MSTSASLDLYGGAGSVGEGSSSSSSSGGGGGFGGDDAVLSGAELQRIFSLSEADRDLLVALRAPGRGVAVKTRRWRLLKFKRCFVAKEMVTFISIKLSVSREDALERANSLARQGCFYHVTHGHSELTDGQLFFRFADSLSEAFPANAKKGEGEGADAKNHSGSRRTLVRADSVVIGNDGGMLVETKEADALLGDADEETKLCYVGKLKKALGKDPRRRTLSNEQMDDGLAEGGGHQGEYAEIDTKKTQVVEPPACLVEGGPIEVSRTLARSLQAMRESDAVPFKSRRVRARVFPRCFCGSDAVDFFMDHFSIPSRTQATLIGLELVTRRWVQHVTNSQPFRDSKKVFYQLTGAEKYSTPSLPETPEAVEEQVSPNGDPSAVPAAGDYTTVNAFSDSVRASVYAESDYPAISAVAGARSATGVGEPDSATGVGDPDYGVSAVAVAGAAARSGKPAPESDYVAVTPTAIPSERAFLATTRQAPAAANRPAPHSTYRADTERGPDYGKMPAPPGYGAAVVAPSKAAVPDQRNSVIGEQMRNSVDKAKRADVSQLTSSRNLISEEFDEDASDFLTKEKVGRWAISREEVVFGAELGRGAYGSVCTGEWRKTPCAIKQVLARDDSAASLMYLEEFEIEAQVLMALRPHVNIVSLLGVIPPSLDGVGLSLVMELMERGTLFDLLVKAAAEGPSSTDPLIRDLSRPSSARLGVLRGLARGLHFLHAEKVVHRDLAARNVLLSNDGVAKIADMGMARILASADEDFQLAEDDGLESDQTKSNVGPIKWMAPEALAEKTYSSATDVWSFACTGLELLTRAKPYAKSHPGVPILKVAGLVMTGALGPADGLAGESVPVSPEARQLLKDCSVVVPKDRIRMGAVVERMLSWSEL